MSQELPRYSDTAFLPVPWYILLGIIAIAHNNLHPSAPPAVLELSTISACWYLPWWTTTLQPCCPVSLLGLLTSPAVDKSHGHPSPNLPWYAERPVSLPTTHQSTTLVSSNSPIKTAANEICVISTMPMPVCVTILRLHGLCKSTLHPALVETVDDK